MRTLRHMHMNMHVRRHVHSRMLHAHHMRAHIPVLTYVIIPILRFEFGCEMYLHAICDECVACGLTRGGGQEDDEITGGASADERTVHHTNEGMNDMCMNRHVVYAST